MRWKRHRDLEPAALLAETVAHHFDDWRVDGHTAHFTVDGVDAAITCAVPETYEIGAYQTATLYLWVTGAGLGDTPAFASASGYGATVDEAIVTGACHWTCAFRAALAGEESFETTLDGRRFEVGIDGYDRTMSTGPIDDPDPADARARLGAGEGWLIERVLASGTLPLLTGPTLLSLFIAAAPERMVEVKVNGRDWAPSLGVFDGCEPEPQGTVSLLRELAVLTPLEPFAGFETTSLQRTLNGIAADPDPEQAGGWQGWAAHGGALGPIWTGDATALPEDYRHFLTRVAGPGAGPGYGLLPPRVVNGVIPLAHAGCGVTWVLRDGEVWVDAAGSDQTYAKVARSFTDWYLAWLDHAVRGAGPWLQWDSAACAPTSVLARWSRASSRRGRPSTSSLSASTGTGSPSRAAATTRTRARRTPATAASHSPPASASLPTCSRRARCSIQA